METALKPRHLKKAMILSVPSFIRIGRHILRLHGQTPKVHANEVIGELRNCTQLPLQGLESAWGMRTGARKPARAEIASLFEAYLNDTGALTTSVDALKVQ